MFYEDSLISPYVYCSLLTLVQLCESVSLPSIEEGLYAENCIRDALYSTPGSLSGSQS